MTTSPYPKLRPLDVRPVTQHGQPALLLRDPLALSEHTLIIPQALAPLLVVCDGTRDVHELRVALALRFGLRVSADVMAQILATLDKVLLLDNARFAEAHEQALAAYRAAPFRPPALAGTSYPDEPSELRRILQAYEEGVDAPVAATDGVRGLVSPHIDYARGGPVYARVWGRAAEAVRAADLVVLLGTDHLSEERGVVTLTRQHYATPFGVLPTAVDVVDALAEALGAETAFAEELHHRSEHSIELAAVWLHYIRGGAACPLVPVLCGSFAPFVEEQATVEEDAQVAALVRVLRPILAGRRAVVVAAGDLAHVGPAFGGPPVDVVGRGRLRAADDALVGRVSAGDAAGFFNEIRRAGDRNNVCGLPPIYLLLRLLEPVTGERVAYAHCPADGEGTSLVSICGVVLGRGVTAPAGPPQTGENDDW
ncbi:MAG: AmmeMemoRadiSam system protein B [Anaerolineae bacterium]|nr:AmmeMemoRadiSam system protein B [Anaerolineae bacterium]